MGIRLKGDLSTEFKYLRCIRVFRVGGYDFCRFWRHHNHLFVVIETPGNREGNGAPMSKINETGMVHLVK